MGRPNRHTGSANKQINKEIFECIADDDMPDGAYLAMAAEFGLDPEDLIEEEVC